MDSAQLIQASVVTGSNNDEHSLKQKEIIATSTSNDKENAECEFDGNFNVEIIDGINLDEDICEIIDLENNQQNCEESALEYLPPPNEYLAFSDDDSDNTASSSDADIVKFYKEEHQEDMVPSLSVDMFDDSEKKQFGDISSLLSQKKRCVSPDCSVNDQAPAVKRRKCDDDNDVVTDFPPSLFTNDYGTIQGNLVIETPKAKLRPSEISVTSADSVTSDISIDYDDIAIDENGDDYGGEDLGALLEKLKQSMKKSEKSRREVRRLAFLVEKSRQQQNESSSSSTRTARFLRGTCGTLTAGLQQSRYVLRSYVYELKC